MRMLAAVAIVAALAACATPTAPTAPEAAVAPAATAPIASPAAPVVARSQREIWNIPTTPFRIADDLWYVGTQGLSAYLFTSPQGHILLDGALPESAPLIKASIRDLGFKVEDVKIILNSHAHLDHSGGLAQLKTDTGAQLAAMSEDVVALETGTYTGSETVASLSAPPVKVDRVLRDGNKVVLGGWELTANLTPGHSRGCTSWSFTATDAGQRYSALVFCSATVAANRITAPLQYPGIVEDYRATFQRVKGMSVDLPLAPHPEFFGLMEKKAKATPGAANPFVDPAATGALIQRLEADFEKTLAERSATR
jgi:metallo-beta-lactamase class B